MQILDHRYARSIYVFRSLPANILPVAVLGFEMCILVLVVVMIFKFVWLNLRTLTKVGMAQYPLRK